MTVEKISSNGVIASQPPSESMEASTTEERGGSCGEAVAGARQDLSGERRAGQCARVDQAAGGGMIRHGS